MLEAVALNAAFRTPKDVWEMAGIQRLAQFTFPDSLVGRRQSLLKADMHQQWLRWFVESIVDPRQIANRRLPYPHVFKAVLDAVSQRFSDQDKTQSEKMALSSLIAGIACSIAESINTSRSRSSISGSQRNLLLQLAGAPPRCWVCGAIFSEQAIEGFLYGEKSEVPMPLFLDVFKPRGLVERDMRIEVDHVYPFSRGGVDDENLRLACGWCNKHKSAHLSMYEVEGQPRHAVFGSGILCSIPQPFWTVRLLATVKACEHPGGCSKSTSTSELTVVKINFSGAPNPTNLRVTCVEHDPMADIRLQPPSIVRAAWASR